MILFLTPGDPEGIGPEITWKAFQSKEVRRLLRAGVRIVAVGAHQALLDQGAKTQSIDPEHLEKELKKIPLSRLPIIAAPTRSSKFLPGYQSGWSIEHAVREVQKDPIRRALVTGPISKTRFRRGGFPFPGHTEFLGHLNHSPSNRPPLMMLANQDMRVVLATIHQSLGSVAKTLKAKTIERVCLEVGQLLERDEKISHPKIAVLGLNPHAGEEGAFGDEESKIIRPAIESAQKILRKNRSRSKIFGPFPADTFFAQQMGLKRKDRFHAVIAMYHDQGLIPIKLIDFDRTVNITLGLNFIRTSVDHGTAFDIVGKNQANPSSLISACLWAAHLLKRKR